MSGSNGKRPVYKVYRLGDASDVAPALERALGAHRERYGGDPVGVTVCPRRLDVVQDALDGRGLDVIGCGGCLWGEVWLQVEPAPVGPLQEERTQDAPQGGGLALPQVEDRKTVSLVARAAAAHREGGEMTPERARERLAQVEQLRLFQEVQK